MTKEKIINAIKEKEEEYRQLALSVLETQGIDSINYISMLSAWGSMHDLLKEIGEEA